jgi:hypothetical protein
MKDGAKIQLSAHEMKLVNNSEWILTKHQIIKKVYEMFGEINNIMKKELIYLNHLFPENIKYQGGKISKGENYQLLPYVILDYPSFFWKNNIFAVRTMFWWGNFFSVTLHLSGHHKTKFINNNPALLSFLKKNNFSICVNEEEWQHNFEEGNYIPATLISGYAYQQSIEQPFFKIAKKLPLTEWESAYDFIMESFKEILDLLQINFRGGKKDLLPGSPIAGSGL